MPFNAFRLDPRVVDGDDFVWDGDKYHFIFATFVPKANFFQVVALATTTPVLA